MTPAEARKAADQVLAEIQKHEEAIFTLRNQYAGLMRIVHGDNLHDAHNQREMQKTLDREAFMDWYWSDEQKGIRAAADQAERAAKDAPSGASEGMQPAVSSDRQKAEKVLSELEPLRQRQQQH